VTKKQLAVIGFGALGHACATAIMHDEQSHLAGVVRRPEHAAEHLPATFSAVPVASHVRELGPVDVALVCVPTEQAGGVGHDLLQHRIAVVDSVDLHGDAMQQHKQMLDKVAVHHRTSAVVGAGWDPGALSLFREFFALLMPKGHTEIRHRSAVQLHHTTLAGDIPGVRDVVAMEQRDQGGRLQRYVYVELTADGDAAQVETAIRSDPLWAGEDVLVFPVDSIAALEDEDHGVVIERRGAAAGVEHQLLLLEARFSEVALSAQLMLAVSRLLPGRRHGAFSLLEIPPAALWGELQLQAEQTWL
jgi:diaminopimelate dehydrogenase